MAPEVTERFDRYEVLAAIGAGGMGEVWKARAQGPHGFEKVVAIKRIHPHWAEDPATAERFIREARIAARLQHSNIVQVFDFGRFDEELFIVMEFVDGCSLEAILEASRQGGGALTAAQALQITTDVARALEYAHRLTDDGGEPVGVIHRDVSPANILVSRGGVVKLTDFGIAAWSAPERSSLVAGKPLYMAPEQLRGDPLDGRADLFAMGIVLYEMLTGERPWVGPAETEEGATLDSVGFVPPSRRDPSGEVPPELDPVVEGLLALDAEARTPSAEALLRQLVDTSYASHIVLDPLALRPLAEAGEASVHAPTERDPSGPPSRTLVAAGVTAEGATLLEASGSVEPRPAAATTTPKVTRQTVAPRSQDRPGGLWLPGLLLGGVAAAAVLGLVVFAIARQRVDEPLVIVTAESTQGSPVGTAPDGSVDEARPEATSRRGDGGGQPEGGAAAEAGDAGPGEAGPPARESPPGGRVGRRHEGPGSRPTTGPRRPTDEGAGRSEGGTGTLNVWSQPWAQIFIDGVRQPRNSPAVGLQVPAGTRRVRLHNPVLGLTAERTVTVPAGGTVTVRVHLQGEDREP